MIYVYDLPMKNKNVTKLFRYGATYKFEKKFKMENRMMYSFVAPGMEKILVVPTFAEQYEEVEKKIKNFKGKKEYKVCKALVRTTVNNEIKEDEIPNDESADGLMKVIYAEYKDITVRFEHMNDRLALSDEFEIRDNNIFGNGIFVSINREEEQA